jgi:hypothetical protein
MDKNQGTAILGGVGKPTNEEIPGLGLGEKMVWEEDGKKVYVNFDLKGKVTGVVKK